jgi:hypothetical protein
VVKDLIRKTRSMWYSHWAECMSRRDMMRVVSRVGVVEGLSCGLVLYVIMEYISLGGSKLVDIFLLCNN